MLLNFGFARKWTNLLMRCVTSVIYRVDINGSIIGPIKPQRGLRQGDPLFPYLFILCVEGLLAMFRKIKQDGRIHGVTVCPSSSSILHLLFADDSFFFFQANAEECLAIKDIFYVYEKTSC